MGLSLKKLEALPGNLFHDVFGGGNHNNPAPPRANGAAPPAVQGQPSAPNAPRPAGVPAPNVNFLLNRQSGQTPPGMKRDKNGNLIPQNANPQGGADPVGNFLHKSFVKPITDLGHNVAGSVVGEAAKLGAAELTRNNTAVASSKAGFKTAVQNIGPPAPYLDANGQPTNTPPQNATKQYFVTHHNPAFTQYLQGAAMSGESGAAAAEAPAEEAVAVTAKSVKSGKTINIKPTAKSTLKVNTAVPQSTADAAHTLSALYNEKAPIAESGNNLLNMAAGRGVRFSKAGDQLEQAINNDYTPAEQLAARDNLENAPNPIGTTPRVQALSNLMSQLNEHGYQTLDKNSTAEEPLHRVQNYATRVARTGNSVVTAVRNGDIGDLLNVKSGHQISRAVQKFVSSKGDVQYGSQTELGLTNKAGALVDSNGVHWKPMATSTSELNANGFNYENNYGKTANKYHSSVGRVKAALDAKSELIRDPEHYGLTKTPPPKDPLNNFVPVKGVPELDGYYAPRKLAGKIEQNLGHPHVPNIGEKALQGLTRGAVQSIVLNPLFHVRNLNELAGLAAGKAKGAFGAAQLKKSYVDVVSMSDKDLGALDDRMHNSGVVHQTYGTDQQTVLSSVLDEVHLPHINKASASAMSQLDWQIRRSLFHLVTDGKNALKDEQAAALVNHFLGDAEASGVIARNLGLFWHYMKTRVNVVASAVAHPRENAGAIVTAAEQAAILFAATKAFQAWTGNKHASIGHPGIAGLVNTVENIAHGRAAAAVTSSINPVITAALNQLYGKDLYTGQTLNTKSARLKNAEQSFIAPTQNISKVSDGKATLAQEALQMGLGVSLPHTKGAPAIPDRGNPVADLINTKGAQAVADEGSIHDPTGLDQATLYYNAKSEALKTVANNPEATDLVNAYLDDNINGKGVKVKKSPEQAMGVAEALSGSPDALDAMRKMQQSQPSHDPMWDLSSSDLKTFLQSQGSSSSSGVKAADEIIDTKFNNGEGFKPFLQRRDDYYTNHKFTGTAQDNPETPKYPSFQGQQQTDYAAYQKASAGWTGAQKAQYLQAHPLAADALTAINKYYGDLNFAQTGLRPKDSVQLSPAQQTWYDWYNSLPKGTGARSQAIKNDPAMWGSISQALAQSDLVSLAKEGAVDQYQGVPFSQKFLKDAKNAGQYDIASVPLPNGTTSYEVNPTAVSAQGSGNKASASLSKFIAKEKSISQNRDAEHASKAARRAIRPNYTRPKRQTVTIKGSPKVLKYRVKKGSVARHYTPLVKLKKSSSSNKARLKVR